MSLYSINIDGMTCNGCRLLTSDALTETGFQNVFVNLEQKLASFSSSMDKESIEAKIKQIEKEIPKFSFSNLSEVNHE